MDEAVDAPPGAARTAVTTGIVAVVLAGLAGLAGALTLDVVWPLALGAAVGLVPGLAWSWRLGAAAVGLAAGWAGFLLRAAALPDTPVGVGVQMAVAVLLVGAAATLSGGRLPLWAGLLGVAAFAGVYEPTFEADPTGFADHAPGAGATAAFGAVLGILVALAARSVAALGRPPGAAGRTGRRRAGADRRTAARPDHDDRAGDGAGAAGDGAGDDLGGPAGERPDADGDESPPDPPSAHDREGGA